MPERKKTIHFSFLLSLLTIVTTALPVSGTYAGTTTETLTNLSIADTYISKTFDTKNFSKEKKLILSYTTDNEAPKSDEILLSFTLPDLPTGASIKKTEFKLHMQDASGNEEVSLSLSRPAESFDTTKVTWETKPKHGSLLEVKTIGTADGWIMWRSEEDTGLTKDLKKWLEDPTDTYDLIVYSDESSDFSRSFSSSDNVDNHPALEITYELSTPAIITNIDSDNATATEATITWTTDEPTDSCIEYGRTDSYGKKDCLTDMVTSHSVTLSNLEPETDYHFQVQSTNAESKLAAAEDMTFTTAEAAADSEGETTEETPDAESETALETDTSADTLSTEAASDQTTQNTQIPQTQNSQTAQQEQYMPASPQSQDRAQMSLDESDSLVGAGEKSDLEKSKDTFLKFAPWVAILSGIIILFRFSMSGYMQNEKMPSAAEYEDDESPPRELPQSPVNAEQAYYPTAPAPPPAYVPPPETYSPPVPASPEPPLVPPPAPTIPTSDGVIIPPGVNPPPAAHVPPPAPPGAINHQTKKKAPTVLELKPPPRPSDALDLKHKK